MLEDEGESESERKGKEEGEREREPQMVKLSKGHPKVNMSQTTPNKYSGTGQVGLRLVHR